MYCLQNRWKLENKRLRYYGLRNKSVMFKNVVKLTAKQAKIVSRLPCELTDRECKCVGKLIGVQIVEENAKRVTPLSLDEARFCARCAANDFIIPGLEFDENGLCPMCQTVDETKNLKSVVPIKTFFPFQKVTVRRGGLLHGRQGFYVRFVLSVQGFEPAGIGAHLGNTVHIGKRRPKHTKRKAELA